MVKFPNTLGLDGGERLSMKLRANKGVGDAVERDNCDVHRCALETDELENVENVESGVLNIGQSLLQQGVSCSQARVGHLIHSLLK